MKTVVTTLALLTILAMTVGIAYATVGARPLAMGGAFIGLADDANATYWNPAGLAQMSAGTIKGTWSYTADNGEQFGTHNFASLVTSYGSSKLVKKIAFGASYLDTDISLPLGLSPVKDEQHTYWGSLAVDAGPLGLIGVNVKKTHEAVEGTSADSDWSIDAGYLLKVSPKLSVGVLAQDVNEPDIRVGGLGTLTKFQNWKAGLAYRPTSDMVITVDGNDLADNGGQQFAMVGVEKVLRNCTVRAGYFGLGSDFEKGATLGFGITKELYDIDAAFLMGDFDNTVMVSADFKMM